MAQALVSAYVLDPNCVTYCVALGKMHELSELSFLIWKLET